MNFLEQLKDDLNNPMKRSGTREKCYVSTSALRQLVGHYERMDSVERVESRSFPQKSIRNRLYDILDCLYVNMDSDALMFMIMDFLSKRIQEKAKEKIITQAYEFNFPEKIKHEFRF